MPSEAVGDGGGTAGGDAVAGVAPARDARIWRITRWNRAPGRTSNRPVPSQADPSARFG